MVGSDGVYQFLGLAVFLGQFSADEGVGPFDLMVHGLAHVVQEADPLGVLDVKPQFAGHAAHNKCYLNGVVQYILGVTGPVLKLAHQPYELRVDAVDAYVESGLFSLFLDGRLHLPGNLLDDLLDACGMYPSI